MELAFRAVFSCRRFGSNFCGIDWSGSATGRIAPLLGVPEHATSVAPAPFVARDNAKTPVADPDDTTRSVRHGEALKIEEILCNPAMAVNFAVLSIVKISAAASFEISSYAFVTETRYAEIATVADQTSKRKRDWRSAGRAPLDRMETRR
jgi:hypothetical protein